MAASPILMLVPAVAVRRLRSRRDVVRKRPVGSGATAEGFLGLWTANMAVGGTSGVIILFYAALAESSEEFEGRLVGRIGRQAMPFASIQRFRPADPAAPMLISAGLERLLQTVARAPGSPLSQGFELYVEQRLGG